MGLRRPGATTKEYEEMPGVNVPVTAAVNGSNRQNSYSRSPTASVITEQMNQMNQKDLELSTQATVSVVPDGNNQSFIRNRNIV